MVFQTHQLLNIANETESVKAIVLISSAVTILDFEGVNDFACEDKDYNRQSLLQCLSMSQIRIRTLNHG
jgi:hypothetical protein